MFFYGTTHKQRHQHKKRPLKVHASDMGETPLHLGQLFSSKERGTCKESRITDFLMECFHPKEKYDVLMNTTSYLKVVL